MLRSRYSTRDVAPGRVAFRQQNSVGTAGRQHFRGSMAGPCNPLPTLRLYPRGHRRTARGRCGSLLLHRSGLPPPTPCRPPGALRNAPIVFSNESRTAARIQNGKWCPWVPVFSACSMALEGVSGMLGSLVETAVGRLDWPHATESALSPTPSLGRCSAPELGSASCSPAVRLRAAGIYAVLNSVPCRSMACMMMASLRARAIRAFRIVERRPMARAQSLRASLPR